ncbi:MAG TPA: response regulator [Bacilli bacterium]
MINVVCIDDERLAVENLKYHLKKFPEINVVGGFTDVQPFYECLQLNDIHLVFMDIEMPGINGLELAAQVLEKYPHIEIVFATAYNQYAVQAFELNAIDYILKPLSPKRIEQTIEKVKSKINIIPKEKKIFIRTFGGFDIFIDDELIPFKFAKAKEVLAYLITKMGKSVGWMTIADDVWPDLYDDKKLMNNFHVASFSLRNFLNENGIGDIYDYSRNLYRIDPTKFECDLFKLHDVYAEYKNTRKILVHPQVFRTGEFLEDLPFVWAYPMAEKVEDMIAELEEADK